MLTDVSVLVSEAKAYFHVRTRVGKNVMPGHIIATVLLTLLLQLSNNFTESFEMKTVDQQNRAL